MTAAIITALLGALMALVQELRRRTAISQRDRAEVEKGRALEEAEASEQRRQRAERAAEELRDESEDLRRRLAGSTDPDDVRERLRLLVDYQASDSSDDPVF